jgi:hypothetical protein
LTNRMWSGYAIPSPATAIIGDQSDALCRREQLASDECRPTMLTWFSRSRIGKGSQAGAIRDGSRQLSSKSRPSSAMNVIALTRIFTSAFANSNFQMRHATRHLSFRFARDYGRVILAYCSGSITASCRTERLLTPRCRLAHNVERTRVY